MPRLIVSQNGQEYRVVEFTTAVTIGRQENGDYLLFDHGNTNAVWMEGCKVNSLRLGHGMTFRIVEYALTFIDDQADHRPMPVFAGEDETTRLPSCSPRNRRP